MILATAHPRLLFPQFAPRNVWTFGFQKFETQSTWRIPRAILGAWFYTLYTLYRALLDVCNVTNVYGHVKPCCDRKWWGLRKWRKHRDINLPRPLSKNWQWSENIGKYLGNNAKNQYESKYQIAFRVASWNQLLKDVCAAAKELPRAWCQAAPHVHDFNVVNKKTKIGLAISCLRLSSSPRCTFQKVFMNVNWTIYLCKKQLLVALHIAFICFPAFSKTIPSDSDGVGNGRKMLESSWLFLHLHH